LLRGGDRRVKAESIGKIFGVVIQLCENGQTAATQRNFLVSPATEVVSTAEFTAEKGRLLAATPL
jgi:hypothetical protein